MVWDAFISYASEDREDVVKPLVKILSDYGLKIWYDKFESGRLCHKFQRN
jgi:hypothetical protein